MNNQAEPSSEALARNFAQVRSQIEEHARVSGRKVTDIQLIAVSKTVSPETVFRVANLGNGMDHHVFGENRVDELQRKLARCPNEAFHFIGTLQTNKVKHVVGNVDLIHSVDSVRLLETINRHAMTNDAVQSVLIQVNISGEVSKQGLEAQEVAVVLERASTLSHIVVNGLMTMAPLGAPEEARSVFNKLRVLREELAPQFAGNVDLKHLSMGMSNDYGVAIEEGSTLIRVGTALFTG